MCGAGFEGPGDCSAADNWHSTKNTGFWRGEQGHTYAQSDRGKALNSVWLLVPCKRVVHAPSCR